MAYATVHAPVFASRYARLLRRGWRIDRRARVVYQPCKLQFVGVYGEPKVSGIKSPRYEGGSSIGRGVSPCSEYKKNMSPVRAAETARNEIVALFMPTCLSSAALVPRAHLFYILLPGASPLRGSAAGLLSYRPRSGL